MAEQKRPEKVKKILDRMNLDCVSKHGLHGYMVKQYAKEICSLFEPKPDEATLIIKGTEHIEEFVKPNEVQVKLSTDDLAPDELDVAYRRGYEEGTVNQDIHTTSIKDVKCQAKIDEIKRELEQLYPELLRKEQIKYEKFWNKYLHRHFDPNVG